MKFFINIMFLGLIILIGCKPEGERILNAYKTGNRNAVISYLNKGGNPNIFTIQDNMEVSLLMEAIRNQDHDLINIILNHSNFQIENEERNDYHALHESIVYRDKQTLSMLLPMIKNLNKGYKSLTPLSYAISTNDKEILELLLPFTEIDYTIVYPEKGQNFLHYAAGRGLVNSVEFLLKSSIEVNLKNIDQKPPLDFARENYQDVVDMLVSNKLDENERVFFEQRKKDFLQVISMLENN